jgi:biopolymer transport protein ExbD
MKRIDSINVIPFIDIMLVLLAIVLTTATFIVEGRLEIRLPESQAQDTQSAVEPVELAIDREGRVFLGDELATLDRLGHHLAAISAETPIVLRVDQDARFAQFVTVVDLLKARGMDKLTILTRKPAS